VVKLDPKTIVLLPFALFMMATVGSELSAARNEAAIPLMTECVSVGRIYLFGGGTQAFYEGMIMCSVGTMLFLAIPGMFGVGLMVLRSK